MNRSELYDFVLQRASEVAAAEPGIYGIALFKRFPSRQRYGPLVWGSGSPAKGCPAAMSAATTTTAARIARSIIRQIDNAPAFEDYGESGWQIVAQMSRKQIADLVVVE